MKAFDVAWTLLKGDPRAYTDHPVIDRLIRQQRLKRLGMIDADLEMNPQTDREYGDKFFDRGSGHQMLRFKRESPALYQLIAEQARSSSREDPYQEVEGDWDFFKKPMPEDPTHNYMDDETREEQKYHEMKGYKFNYPEDYYTSFEPHPTKDYDDLETEKPNRGVFNVRDTDENKW